MSIDGIRGIKQALLNEYGHFADRRLKNIDKGSRFIIDDRDRDPSHGSDGTPYGWFCEMFVDVEGADAIKVTIIGPLPSGPSVEAWLKESGGVLHDGPFSMRDRRTFAVGPADIKKLVSLANAQRSLIAGARNRDKSDYFVCPRIAACLMRLYGVLEKHWGC